MAAAKAAQRSLERERAAQEERAREDERNKQYATQSTEAAEQALRVAANLSDARDVSIRYDEFDAAVLASRVIRHGAASDEEGLAMFRALLEKCSLAAPFARGAWELETMRPIKALRRVADSDVWASPEARQALVALGLSPHR